MSDARRVIEAESPKDAFRKMQRYYKYSFSIGNSTHGPVGYCVDVIAASREEALALLKENLPEGLEIELPGIDPAKGAFVNAAVYLNADAITERDIVDEEPYYRQANGKWHYAPYR